MAAQPVGNREKPQVNIGQPAVLILAADLPDVRSGGKLDPGGFQHDDSANASSNAEYISPPS